MKYGLRLLGLGGMLLTTPAFGGDSNYLMVSLGDSITAGAFANTSTQQNLPLDGPLSNLLNLKDDLTNGLLWAAVDNKDTYSWASGTSTNSHYVRLQKYLQSQSSTPVTVNIANVAVSGDESKGLADQLTKVEAMLNVNDPPAVPYVTLFIGANDACDGVSANDVYSNVYATLQRVAQFNHGNPVKVLMPEIPTIPELGQDGIKNYTTKGGYTCEFIRSDILHFCNSLTHWTDAADYRNKINIVNETNAAVVAAASEAGKAFPNLDIHTSTVVHDFNLYVQILGGECFHPNQIGQGMIADQLWADTPWFK